MSVYEGSITTVSPAKERTPNNIKTKLSEMSITGNEITQEPDNPSTKAKMDSIIDEKT